MKPSVPIQPYSVSILNPTVSHAHSQPVDSIRPSVSMHSPISIQCTLQFRLNPQFQWNLQSLFRLLRFQFYYHSQSDRQSRSFPTSGLSPTIGLNTPSNFDSIPSSNGTYSINPTTGLDEAFSFSSTFFGFNSTTFFKPTVSNVHSQPSIGLDPIIGINTTLLSFDSIIRSIDPNPTTVMLSPKPTIEFNKAFSLAEPTIPIRSSV